MQRDKFRRVAKVYKWLSIFFLATFLITGALTLFNRQSFENTVEFQHIHGLGYTNNGEELYVPAHDGLRIFSHDEWGIPEGEKHDYMGFSITDEGFYSSGHPSPSSNMKNPFGIVKSDNMGRNLERLDLYGEIDFHSMTAGYYSHVIYVQNPEPNSRMEETGLYYTLDDTKTWEKSQMNGVSGQPAAMAVHPTLENIIVISTNEGVFLSEDYGNTFEILMDIAATSLALTEGGDLFVGTITEEASLIKVNINSGEESALPIPGLSEGDAISYVAINPQDSNEIVFTTFQKDLFLTRENGKHWEQIVTKGVATSN
ncbi:hypothetical protein IQ283_08060 (plasmid) [Alkalihalobacillus hwajinpoensis]|uniref:F510_1955 family glycosylhydrolase n=1 Tax=Guptibacillus hwajinpoensis TaxID=208199 RepID=UPI0018843C9E|nr:hypothetical protein [Pseudalkalibacillus hwajinpoensis]MBF0706563.1 hypothetical protein [Pseudalkalibacillus hwajinpoensis]